MNSCLSYSYSTGLNPEKENEINQKVKKSREKFPKGFAKGASYSFEAYSVYSMVITSAHGADGINLVPHQNEVCGGYEIPIGHRVGMQPAPRSAGFRPLSDLGKGTVLDRISSICGIVAKIVTFT